jgi:hypothetical protein
MANLAVTKGHTVIPQVCKFVRKVYTSVFTSLSPPYRIYKGRQKRLAVEPRNRESLFKLHEHFTTARFSSHYNPKRQCIVETDVPDFALGAVLSQKGRDDLLHPIVYHLRKFSPAEIYYEIHDKELLAVVDSFKVWGKYLEGALLMVLVYTDYQNLEYFTTSKVINRRQAHWAQELAGIDFKICYQSRSQNRKPDALPRHSMDRPPTGGSEDQPIQMVLQKIISMKTLIY